MTFVDLGGILLGILIAGLLAYNQYPEPTPPPPDRWPAKVVVEVDPAACPTTIHMENAHGVTDYVYPC